jgi:flagellar biosynthesis protein FlhG
LTARTEEGLAQPALPLESLAPEPTARVWAVGGGKGGIGKSFLAANLAAAAARSGRPTILVDADLGGANLHTCLGVRGVPRSNLGDYLDCRLSDLEQAAVDTAIPRLRLVPGVLGRIGALETSPPQRQRLLKAIRELPAEVVIVDLAAGVERSTLDLFLVSEQSFVVTTPEPTAIENAYAFLRAAIFRRLAALVSGSPLAELLDDALDARGERGVLTPGDLLAGVAEHDAGEAERLRAALAAHRPRLIVNQVRAQDEVKLGFSIRSVCRKHFGIDLDYVGYVSFDDYVWRSVKERRPLVVSHPNSDGALYIRRIMNKILDE